MAWLIGYWIACVVVVIGAMAMPGRNDPFMSTVALVFAPIYVPVVFVVTTFTKLTKLR
jgi:energy-converting hydrogenase Eha subunit E